MDIIAVERFGREELLDRLRRTPLIGFNGVEVYADAAVELCAGVDPDRLVPAQRYVLRESVATVRALRSALLPHGVDLFGLDGGAWVRTADAPDEPIPVIPPVIEASEEPDGRRVLLVNDGLHRVYAARSVGSPINSVVIDGVLPEFPYYALALSGWEEVVELDDLPDGFQKKTYRIPSNYKALFRNFNAVFPGVQAQRKRTNPDHLQP